MLVFINKEKILEVFDSIFDPSEILIKKEIVPDFLDYCALNNLVRVFSSFDYVGSECFLGHRLLGGRFLNESGIDHYVNRAFEDSDFEVFRERTCLPIVKRVFNSPTFWSKNISVIELANDLYFY